MDISSIANLEVYAYREKEYKDGRRGKKLTKVTDLDIGETGYFNNSSKNKIVRLNEDTYRFYRYDEIQTHIVDQDSNYSIDDIKKNINSQLNYNLKYADERVELVEELLEEKIFLEIEFAEQLKRTKNGKLKTVIRSF